MSIYDQTQILFHDDTCKLKIWLWFEYPKGISNDEKETACKNPDWHVRTIFAIQHGSSNVHGRMRVSEFHIHSKYVADLGASIPQPAAQRTLALPSEYFDLNTLKTNFFNDI